MTRTNRLHAIGTGLAVALLTGLPALAQDAAAAAPTIDKGDTTWMLVSTILVIAMTIPGLALFYGGLVRAKNMLSVLMQVFATFAMIALLQGGRRRQPVTQGLFRAVLSVTRVGG